MSVGMISFSAISRIRTLTARCFLKDDRSDGHSRTQQNILNPKRAARIAWGEPVLLHSTNRYHISRRYRFHASIGDDCKVGAILTRKIKPGDKLATIHSTPTAIRNTPTATAILLTILSPRITGNPAITMDPTMHNTHSINTVVRIIDKRLRTITTATTMVTTITTTTTMATTPGKWWTPNGQMGQQICDDWQFQNQCYV
ncbi:hypothetical protein OESDEN_11591 [Oesophagostomum dentatum]|uniref:Uncharacterized protein n=1 Tax=Oesophagostomum dentatum TaxID=61180 RepID=A0A0B1STI8_OESDE|nr:hypothetical protein OESDEN_11591 [Oesophagostomum dentatum]